MEIPLKIKELAKGELQIMQILWKKEKAFVNEIIEVLPDPKPAYNTVSTIVRVLEKKGIVGHRSYGKSHRYHPLISKSEYTEMFMGNVLNNFFGNSLSNLVSFFSEHEKISMKEMEKILEILHENAGRKAETGDTTPNPGSK